MHAAPCGDQVCLTPPEASSLWLWVRDVQRWAEMASVCLTPLKLDEAPVAAATVTHPATEVFSRQEELISLMRADHPQVRVTVIWTPCGEENSYYYPGSAQIQLCTEFEAHPDAALFVAAHEMGHAIAVQELGVDDEESADELAALAMIEHGYTSELLGASLFFQQQAHQDHRKGDGHPGNRFRAWNLACLAAGAEGSPLGCVILYRATALRWDIRLWDAEHSGG